MYNLNVPKSYVEVNNMNCAYQPWAWVVYVVTKVNDVYILIFGYRPICETNCKKEKAMNYYNQWEYNLWQCISTRSIDQGII